MRRINSHLLASHSVWYCVNPCTAGAAYIRVFIFYSHIKYHILNMLKMKCNINQQDLKRVDLHFVKSTPAVDYLYQRDLIIVAGV